MKVATIFNDVHRRSLRLAVFEKVKIGGTDLRGADGTVCFSLVSCDSKQYTDIDEVVREAKKIPDVPYYEKLRSTGTASRPLPRSTGFRSEHSSHPETRLA